MMSDNELTERRETYGFSVGESGPTIMHTVKSVRTVLFQEV